MNNINEVDLIEYKVTNVSVRGGLIAARDFLVKIFYDFAFK